MPMVAGYTCKPLVKLPKDPAGCWEWQGANNGRYPVKEYFGTTIPGARWVWLMLFGPLAEGLVVSQACGNLNCVNPQHLVTKTLTEIAQDKSALVPGDIAEIRLMMENGHPATLLAQKFGIHKSTVYRIAKRKTWAPKKATNTGD